MTPDEQALLNTYTQDIYSQVIGLIIYCAGYGTLLIASAITAYLIPNPFSGKNRILMICLGLIFINSALLTIDICGATLSMVKFEFIKNLNEGLEVQGQAAFMKGLPWAYIRDWPITINLLLSDFVVCWRACMLFWEHKAWRVVLVILMGANIGVNLADCIWDDVSLVALGEDGVLDWISVVISFGVNLMATLMIAYMAWSHYQNAKMASVAHKNKSVKLLFFLFESGAIFCAFQLISMVLSIMAYVERQQSSENPTITQVIEPACGIGTALYPVIVLILVRANYSPVVETSRTTQSGLD